jgi:hypothetical protein
MIIMNLIITVMGIVFAIYGYLDHRNFKFEVAMENDPMHRRYDTGIAICIIGILMIIASVYV